MHQKRNEVPRTWPIARKGTKQVVVPKHNKRNGIPLLIVLRDILKIAKKRKEVERIIREGRIKVNGKAAKDDRFAMLFMDILSVGDKSYKLVFENKKFKLQDTREKEKIVKVVGKRVLNKNKIQVNLSDGRNMQVKDKLKIGESLAVDFDGKILRKIELKEGAKIVVMSGSHLGEEGKVEKIADKTAIISIGKEKVNLNLKSIMAV